MTKVPSLTQYLPRSPGTRAISTEARDTRARAFDSTRCVYKYEPLRFLPHVQHSHVLDFIENWVVCASPSQSVQWSMMKDVI